MNDASISVTTMEGLMVQKIDKDTNDSKKSIANKSLVDDKNRQHKSNKTSNHKSGRNVSKINDPSGLPKYR